MSFPSCIQIFFYLHIPGIPGICDMFFFTPTHFTFIHGTNTGTIIGDGIHLDFIPIIIRGDGIGDVTLD